MIRSTLCAGAALVTGVLVTTPTTAHDAMGLFSERNLPPEVLAKIDERARKRDPALVAAVEEVKDANPALARTVLRSLTLPANVDDALESVFDARALWPQNAQIKVCFLDGDQAARQRVLGVAAQVFEHTNLTLDSTTPDCTQPGAQQIRATFLTQGFWSYIGTDANFIDFPAPTLGLENFDLVPSFSADQEGTVVHEFMHAVGALHEHQHPDSVCEEEFNWPAVYRLLPWEKDDVDFNMRRIAQTINLAITPYNGESVMHYKLDARFFLEPEHATCLLPMKNTKLSADDIGMLGQLYPQQ